MTDAIKLFPNNPGLALELERARLEIDAETLEILINRRIRQLWPNVDVSQVVNDFAPDWEWIDITAFGDVCPRVALSMYNGSLRSHDAT